MAYIDDLSIPCKNCGHSGVLKWVIGVGPHTKKGDPPDYVKIQDAGSWIIKKSGKTIQVFCPTCNELVTERST